MSAVSTLAWLTTWIVNQKCTCKSLFFELRDCDWAFFSVLFFVVVAYTLTLRCVTARARAHIHIHTRTHTAAAAAAYRYLYLGRTEAQREHILYRENSFCRENKLQIRIPWRDQCERQFHHPCHHAVSPSPATMSSGLGFRV